MMFWIPEYLKKNIYVLFCFTLVEISVFSALSSVSDIMPLEYFQESGFFFQGFLTIGCFPGNSGQIFE